MNRKFFTLLISCSILLNVAKATNCSDSVSLGGGYPNTTYYRLFDGNKTTVPFNDWHLAFSVQPSAYPTNTLQGTTIRINEAFGTQVYIVRDSSPAAFLTKTDTIGLSTWTQLHDDTANLDTGALNYKVNIGATPIYGWGHYNFTSHNVTGDSLFIIQLPSGAYKKLFISALTYDTSWTVIYADLNNANPDTVTILKNNYPNKNFVYLDLTSKTLRDKEPNHNAWDLQFLHYSSPTPTPGSGVIISYPFTGVWLNKGDSGVAVNNVDINAAHYQNQALSPAMNVIGYNWKHFDFGTNKYVLNDSIVYFVKDHSGVIYKIVLCSFNSSTGTIGISRSSTVGINEVANQTTVLDLYPNPTNSQVNIMFHTEKEGLVTYQIMDVTGRKLVEENSSATNGFNTHSISVNELSNGIYLLNMISNGQTTQNKFVVAK